MDDPVIVEQAPLLLAGLSYYGDPFAYHMEWQIENEIGHLWTRFYRLIQADADFQQQAMQAGVMYEAHILHPESRETGRYEVFVGSVIEDAFRLSPLFVLKHLPARRYLKYEVSGQAIVDDIEHLQVEKHMQAAGVQRDPAYHLLAYDERFLGMDRLDESTVSVLIPILAA